MDLKFQLELVPVWDLTGLWKGQTSEPHAPTLLSPHITPTLSLPVQTKDSILNVSLISQSEVSNNALKDILTDVEVEGRPCRFCIFSCYLSLDFIYRQL